MNWSKTELRNLRLLDIAYNKGVNKVKFAKNNTYKHELIKAIVCYILLKRGYKLVTEARFTNGLRADVIDLSNSICYEVVCSEREASMMKKKKDYPISIEFIKSNIYKDKSLEFIKENLESLIL